MFEELRATRPAHISYSLFRAGDDFSHLFINSAGDAAEPLTELPSFKAYVTNIASRCVAPPTVVRIDANLLESYGLA